jgi:hypothetical protein
MGSWIAFGVMALLMLLVPLVRARVRGPHLAWSRVAELLPAPAAPGGHVRVAQYLDVAVCLYLTEGWNHLLESFLTLEPAPAGIRIRSLGRADDGAAEAFIPWAAIDSFREPSGNPRGAKRRHRRPMIVLSLGARAGDVWLERPAGWDAWIQWRMARGNGEATPILAAEPQQGAPPVDAETAARLPALEESGRVRWKPSELRTAVRMMRGGLFLALASATGLGGRIAESGRWGTTAHTVLITLTVLLLLAALWHMSVEQSWRPRQR